MVPRLSEGAVDKQNWQSFIEVIKEIYQNDDLIEIKTNFLEFKAGEHPKLPLEGHKSCASAQRFREATQGEWKNKSIRLLGSHGRILVLEFNIGTRLSTAGASTAGKRSMTRWILMSRLVTIHSNWIV